MLSFQPCTHEEWIPPARQLPRNCLSQFEAMTEPGWEKVASEELIVHPEGGIVSQNDAIVQLEPEIVHKPRTWQNAPMWLRGYFTGNDKLGYTIRPPWMRYFSPPKLQPGPQARIDKSQAETIARLTVDIQKDAEEDSPRGQAYIGSKIGAYACVATDGRRALLVRDAFKGKRAKRKWLVNSTPKPDDPHFVLADSDIMNGLRRLETITKGSSSCVKFSLSAEAESVVLSASDADGIEGTETYDCETTGPVEIAFNPAHIIPALGTWPMTVYFKDDESLVVMMPKKKQRDFMYVVMPMKL